MVTAHDELLLSHIDVIEADGGYWYHWILTYREYPISFKRLFSLCVKLNRTLAIKRILDYHNVPANISLKERIALYQLLEEDMEFFKGDIHENQ